MYYTTDQHVNHVLCYVHDSTCSLRAPSVCNTEPLVNYYVTKQLGTATVISLKGNTLIVSTQLLDSSDESTCLLTARSCCNTEPLMNSYGTKQSSTSTLISSELHFLLLDIAQCYLVILAYFPLCIMLFDRAILLQHGTLIDYSVEPNIEII